MGLGPAGGFGRPETDRLAPLEPRPAGDAAAASARAKTPLLRLNVYEIDDNPFQPRRDFGDAEIASLAESLKEHDMLQPVLVRRQGRSLPADLRRAAAARRDPRRLVHDSRPRARGRRSARRRTGHRRKPAAQRSQSDRKGPLLQAVPGPASVRPGGTGQPPEDRPVHHCQSDATAGTAGRR